jgi:hypothetical protein
MLLRDFQEPQTTGKERRVGKLPKGFVLSFEGRRITKSAWNRVVHFFAKNGEQRAELLRRRFLPKF